MARKALSALAATILLALPVGEHVLITKDGRTLTGVVLSETRVHPPQGHVRCDG